MRCHPFGMRVLLVIGLGSGLLATIGFVTGAFFGFNSNPDFKLLVLLFIAAGIFIYPKIFNYDFAVDYVGRPAIALGSAWGAMAAINRTTQDTLAGLLITVVLVAVFSALGSLWTFCFIHSKLVFRLTGALLAALITYDVTHTYVPSFLAVAAAICAAAAMNKIMKKLGHA